MNIDFNSFFRMRVDVTKLDAISDQYELTIERVDLEDNFYSSKNSFYMNKEQLTKFANYLSEVVDGLK